MTTSVVTGATGHLGNVLVRELCAQGDRVRAVVQPRDDLAPLKGLPVELVEGDVTRPEALARAFAGADRVFHLAGVVSITRGQAERLWAVNVGGPRAVLAACREVGVRRLVHTGSVHALAEPRGGVLDEAAGFDPARVTGPYARTKAVACLELQRAARAGEVDAVLVLPTAVVGPFDFRLSEVGQLLLALEGGRVPLLLPGGHDFVDVRDVARGTVLAAERGRRGEAYLLGGAPLTLREVAEEVAAVTGARVPPVLPRWLARALATSAPLVEAVTRKRALLTPYAVRAVSAPFTVSHEKAARELGFAPRPPREALRDALAWFHAQAAPRVVPGPGRVVAPQA